MENYGNLEIQYFVKSQWKNLSIEKSSKPIAKYILLEFVKI